MSSQIPKHIFDQKHAKIQDSLAYVLAKTGGKMALVVIYDEDGVGVQSGLNKSASTNEMGFVQLKSLGEYLSKVVLQAVGFSPEDKRVERYSG